MKFRISFLVRNFRNSYVSCRFMGSVSVVMRNTYKVYQAWRCEPRKIWLVGARCLSLRETAWRCVFRRTSPRDTASFLKADLRHKLERARAVIQTIWSHNPCFLFEYTRALLATFSVIILFIMSAFSLLFFSLDRD